MVRNLCENPYMTRLLPILLTLAVFLFLTTEGWSAESDKNRLCLSGTEHSHYAIMNRCSDSYDKGDYATALREWRPLAEQGHAPAQFNLGWMYDEGKGVPKDYKTAFKWYRLAAEQRFAFAQSNLDVMVKIFVTELTSREYLYHILC